MKQKETDNCYDLDSSKWQQWNCAHKCFAVFSLFFLGGGGVGWGGGRRGPLNDNPSMRALICRQFLHFVSFLKSEVSAKKLKLLQPCIGETIISCPMRILDNENHYLPLLIYLHSCHLWHILHISYWEMIFAFLYQLYI